MPVDLGFHRATFALIDPDFAKEQLILLLRKWYMHPNGQIQLTSGRSAMLTRRSPGGRLRHKIEEQQTGTGDPRVPGKDLPKTVAQFHVVGQS